MVDADVVKCKCNGFYEDGELHMTISVWILVYSWCTP